MCQVLSTASYGMRGRCLRIITYSTVTIRTSVYQNRDKKDADDVHQGQVERTLRPEYSVPESLDDPGTCGAVEVA